MDEESGNSLYLDSIQPTIEVEENYLPSFSQSLLIQF